MKPFSEYGDTNIMNPNTKKINSNKPKKAPKKFKIREGSTVKELCENLGLKARALIEKIESEGFSISVKTEIYEDLKDTISKIINRNIEIISIEDEIGTLAESKPDEMIIKAPVVTIMGHVDHGKTTLLDSIQESNLVNKESGGITQHIGAYQIRYNNRSITFIDTPGHEAFTKLRARGANLTDIVILIVAADDGVMPQTKEAIDHAKAADVPIIVAINKIDKPEADPDKTKQQLSKAGLLVEDWGGDIISIDISAKEKTNLNELLELILLLSDMNEFKGNPKVPAQGVILESHLDSKKGPVATVIIQHGILINGKAFISGSCYGKVKALFDENGKAMEKAEMGMPVEILGFSNVPAAGDYFQVVENIEIAKKLSQYRLSQEKKDNTQKKESLTLDQLFENIQDGKIKNLPLIIKADVQGSVDVLCDILPNLSTDKVKIQIIHSASGKITESDISLAYASDSIIIGYNSKPSSTILEEAKKENVEVRNYNIIYELTEDIKKAMIGLLDPIIKEKTIGKAEVKKTFHIPRIGAIAGCLVKEGKILRKASIRIIREGDVIHEGHISSLKHLKNNVTEVKRDYECGIGIENFKDIQVGDTIEAFISEKNIPESL